MRILIGAIAGILLFCMLCYPADAATKLLPTEADTYAEQGFPSAAPWNNRNVYIGYDRYYNKRRTRAFLKVDVEDLLEDEILADDISSVRLRMFMYEYEGGGTYYVDVYNIRDTWSEYSLTWNTQPAIAEQISHNPVTENYGWKIFDLTNWAKQTLSGTKTNRGFSLRASNETDRAGIYWSIACQSAPPPPVCIPGQQPYVEVIYTPNQPPSKPQLTAPENDHLTAETQINFSSSESIDPEGEDIKYKLEIAADPGFSSLKYKSVWQESPDFNITIRADGHYFWRVKAQDEHGPKTGQIISQPRTFTVDTTAPSIPDVHFEPPFTPGTTNSIEWDLSTDNLSSKIFYQVEMATSADFSNIVQTTEWIEDTAATFEGLKDGTTYFFRLKAKDEAENESAYSEATSSTQDTKPPDVKNFTVTPSYISPTNPTSKGTNDHTIIKAQVVDTSLQNSATEIYNSKHKLIQIFTEGKHDIVRTWPNSSSKLPDGKYFIYISAEDSFHARHHSKAKTVILDDTTPVKPTIQFPNAGFLTNKTRLTTKIVVERWTHDEVFVNNRNVSSTQVGSQTQISPQITKFREGTNSLKVTSTDSAGNNNSTTINFTVDTTPPGTPKIKLYPDTNNRSIDLTISGEKNSTAKVFINGRLTTKFLMADTKVTKTILKNWRYSTTYSVFIRLTDPAGNTSKDSNTAKYTTPQERKVGIGGGLDKPVKFPSVPGIRECHIEIHKDRQSYKIGRCTVPTPRLARVINRGTLEDKNYWVDTFGSAQQKMKLKVTIKKCKPRSFLDPRTWYSCVDIIEKKGSATGTPRNRLQQRIDSVQSWRINRQRIDSSSHFTLETTVTSNPKGKDLFTRNSQHVSTKIAGIWIEILRYSNYSNPMKIPAGYSSKTGRAYFSFPFAEHIGVTQWHGYTAFQSPHMGIDFGSVRESIKAPADGYLRAIGWDNYYGKCFSGGNYVRIEHDNGMHTVYFHLENYKKSNGQNWRVGERIRRGEQVGISGNTGAWNCKGFGYHLHYELRKNRSQSSHVDPVPYTNVDWNRIPTLNAKRIPGRLTGDNPHPGW